MNSPSAVSRPKDPSAADRAETRAIRSAIRELSRAYREAHPWLDRSQNAIGLVLQLSAFAGMVGTAVLYARGQLSALVTVVLIAFACSIAHEIEHDLIHLLYFPRQPWVRHGMLAIGWLMRPSTVNPWIRSRLHLHHHRASGTPTDLEERAITNGERWGLKRLLMTADGLLSTWLRLPYSNPRKAWRQLLRGTLGYGPLTWLYHVAIAADLILHLQQWRGGLSPEAQLRLVALDFVMVIWALPNILRTFSLHFVSSNLHYYGDIAEGDILRQTQVLNHPLLMPLQLFCFNFGSTHAIHHFWVSEPFYLRQLTAADAHAVMRERGVRFNDLGTFWRANRYGSRTVPALTETETALASELSTG
ncbi:MAG TPA: fatty acid desaturase [Polyangiales bacterium]|nr:fatty acid desaturase [Polyangiales bacterium]